MRGGKLLPVLFLVGAGFASESGSEPPPVFYHSTPPPAGVSHAHADSIEALTSRYDHYSLLENRGKRFMIAGLGSGIAGGILFTVGVAQARSTYEPGRWEGPFSNEKMNTSLLLGFGMLAGAPLLLISGAIMHAHGKESRTYYQRLLEEAGTHARLDLGPDRVKLSYTF